MTMEPARIQLLALAAAVRGQDWADQLDTALSAAALAGWSWQRAGREACRLIFTDDADPREIRDAVKAPIVKTPGASHAAVRVYAERRALVDAATGPIPVAKDSNDHHD